MNLRERIAEDPSLTEQIVSTLTAREIELNQAADAFVSAAGALARAYESAETIRNFALDYLQANAWRDYRKQHPRPLMPEGNDPPRYFVRKKGRK